jgi:5-methylcytosine-specific restriction protein A
MSEINIKKGEIFNNTELCEIFLCSTQRGMRKSNTTNTLVLISNHLGNNVYEDKWIEGILHYTGMGQTGDQDINWAQNRTLAESRTNNVEIHLFEVFNNGEYTYQGKVHLIGDPYKSKQLDQNNNLRDVYIFPLGLEGNEKPTFVKEEDYREKVERQERAAKRISNDELADRIGYMPNEVGQREVNSIAYERNPLVSEYARRRANGKCELCGKDAPFVKSDGTPYLEIHHIKWLAKGGEDNISNTVALCPNCHRRMHVLDLPEDVDKLYSIKKEIS